MLQSQVYDDNRWFSMGTCSNYSKWELMIKQKSASNSSEQKFRWTQPANPFTCSYADIHGKVVHNTNTKDGYTNYNYGGLFRKNSSTFLATDNNTNGSNWFGAVGSWAEYGGDCNGCEGCKYDHLMKSVVQNPIDAHRGQHVMIETPTVGVVKGALALYVLPLILLFISIRIFCCRF